MRLSKYLSTLGFCSRRKADILLEQKKITVNSHLASLGQKVVQGDIICFEKEKITVCLNDLPSYSDQSFTNQVQVLAFHKPINTLCSHRDRANRALIYDSLPKGERPLNWYCIGRLDFKTTGLLLLTNSGELAHRLMHPSFETKRVYHVKIKPQIASQTLKRLYQGVRLDDKTFSKVQKARLLEQTQSSSWIEITLMQGRYREVRRLMEKIGHDVLKLKRVCYGSVNLKGLQEPGDFRILEQSEITSLLKSS